MYRDPLTGPIGGGNPTTKQKQIIYVDIYIYIYIIYIYIYINHIEYVSDKPIHILDATLRLKSA